MSKLKTGTNIMQHTSLLLGAGFSVNQGYPTAKQLNDNLVNLDPEDFYINTDGTVSFKKREEEDPCWFSSYASVKFFIIKLIKFYQIHTEKEFNYEEFYDFYNELYKDEKKLPEFDDFCDKFRNELQIDTDNYNLLSNTNKVFNQLVSHYLVDKDGNRFHAPIHYSKPTFPGYTGFLDCVENWGKNGFVHIHTLNHDLFFEVFKSSDWLNGELCDGFIENDSPYYGTLENTHKVRLSYFTNKYKGKYRLYKLHGSVDQFPFYIPDKQSIDNYVKTKPGIRTSDLYKEIDRDGELIYFNYWLNYHSDFLSGTISKILRYREPCYYEKVFTHFENNLSNSNSLILIGYGCGDIEVNNLIKNKFDYKNKPLFVVDPFPSDKTYKFIEEFNGKLIKKTPEELNIDDFEK